MKVSCLCPTYNRVPTRQYLLEEAIESFVRQDYPDKELLILNDNSQQILTCAAPNVIIINVPQRFQSLGEKYNALVGLSSGWLLAPWEDDDISLPWRLSLSVRALAVADADYYNPRRYWFYQDAKYHHQHKQGVGHACSVYTRHAFTLAGGYPFISGAQDMVFDRKLLHMAVSCGAPVNDSPELHISKWFYIGRWDTGSSHLSGNMDHEKYYARAGNHRHKAGTYQLRPHWRVDYTAAIRDRLCQLN